MQGASFRQLKSWVDDERYLVTKHAVDRLEEREILEWQVVAMLDQPTQVREFQLDTGERKVEIQGLLSDGSEIRSIWSLDEDLQAAVLVTVYHLS